MNRRLNILLSAYYCSPYRGGESAVGWQTAIGLAKYHDVTLICGDHSDQSPTALDLARYKEENGFPERLSLVHVQAQGMARKFFQLHQLPGLWFVYYEGYRLWQKQVLEVARGLHADKPFDLVHQLTIITFREPGYLWQLGIPWFWGPINGAANVPWKFLQSFGTKGCYRHITRNILNIIHTRFSPRCRTAAKRAAKVWTVTREDQKMVEHLWKARAETMLETGTTPQPTRVPKTLSDGEPLKMAWCGTIEARKALNLLLTAIHALPNAQAVELHVIGSGPEEMKSRQLAGNLGVSAVVKWHGRVNHDEAQKMMASCHLLVHTALKEGTPHAVLEAMSRGLPVICHDACGMGIAVNDSCGIKVPLHNPATSIRGFKEAIERLLATPDLLASLSEGALKRAGHLTWQSHTSRICQSYESVLNEKAPAPQLT